MISLNLQLVGAKRRRKSQLNRRLSSIPKPIVQPHPYLLCNCRACYFFLYLVSIHNYILLLGSRICLDLSFLLFPFNFSFIGCIYIHSAFLIHRREREIIFTLLSVSISFLALCFLLGFVFIFSPYKFVFFKFYFL